LNPINQKESELEESKMALHISNKKKKMVWAFGRDDEVNFSFDVNPNKSFKGIILDAGEGEFSEGEDFYTVFLFAFKSTPFEFLLSEEDDLSEENIVFANFLYIKTTTPITPIATIPCLMKIQNNTNSLSSLCKHSLSSEQADFICIAMIGSLVNKDECLMVCIPDKSKINPAKEY
jgi:hypothetical protein